MRNLTVREPAPGQLNRNHREFFPPSDILPDSFTTYIGEPVVHWHQDPNDAPVAALRKVATDYTAVVTDHIIWHLNAHFNCTSCLMINNNDVYRRTLHKHRIGEAISSNFVGPMPHLDLGYRLHFYLSLTFLPAFLRSKPGWNFSSHWWYLWQHPSQLR